VEDQPHSTYAQEIAKNIFTEILPYLNVFRTEELSDEEVEQLKALHIIPDESAVEESQQEITVQTADGEKTYQIDPETGYAVDPDTGAFLDPTTLQPVDLDSSDLDGIVGVENKPVEDDGTESSEFTAGAGNAGQSSTTGGRTQTTEEQSGGENAAGEESADEQSEESSGGDTDTGQDETAAPESSTTDETTPSLSVGAGL
jgi:stage V sporulation protein D (sporulation-specific penicillin-binding protein)